MSSRPGPDWTNTQLVAACLAGDERAWNTLLDRYKNLIYSIPVRYGVPPQDAADIFQAVCMDLFNEMPRIRDAEALQGWLIRVTTHKCYHWKRKLTSPGGEHRKAELEDLIAADPVVAGILTGVEREQMVRDAIDALPPRCRELIEMLFFETPPLAYHQVAQRLNLAPGSIGFIRGRCLKKLRKELKERGF
jgi:RNA polymerase sigma factor (sigma-70 family)